jgi:hypothetical protein
MDLENQKPELFDYTFEGDPDALIEAMTTRKN